MFFINCTFFNDEHVLRNSPLTVRFAYLQYAVNCFGGVVKEGYLKKGA